MILDARRCRTLMEQRRLDGVVATSRNNVYYCSDSDIGAPLRLAPVFLFRDGDPVFAVHANAEVKARRTTWIDDVRVYQGGEWVPLAIWDFIADVLTERGLEAARVGLELLDVPGLALDHVRSRLPRAEFVDCGNLFSTLRAIKSDDELRWLSRVNLLTAKAITVAFEMTRPGDTERNVAHIMRSLLLEYGADRITFLNLGAGVNTLEHQHVPTKYRLQKGDMVHVDFGGCWNGYMSDISRMAVVGEPTSQQRQAHRVVVRAMWDTVEALRSGSTVLDVHHAAKASYASQGFRYPRLFIGHSLGIGLHETPMLGEAHGAWRLQPGMFFQVEPDLAEWGFRVHTEDSFIVRADAPAQIVSEYKTITDPQIIT